MIPAQLALFVIGFVFWTWFLFRTYADYTRLSIWMGWTGRERAAFVGVLVVLLVAGTGGLWLIATNVFS